MRLLEERILADGKVFPGDVLKVDSFLNHQMDIALFSEMGDEFYRLYQGQGINKILTVEASGIAIAALTALKFNCPMVFAKKSKSSNMGANQYAAKAHSYTHNTDNTILVSKEYLTANDKVLIIDDFLANGCAISALVDLCNQAGAQVVGAGVAIEKVYQGGGNALRNGGLRVESLARIASMNEEDGIKFC